MARNYGLSCDAAFLNGRFRAAFKASPPLAFGRVSEDERLRLEKQWWEQVVRAVFTDIAFPRFESFFDALYRYFGRGEAWRLFPETQAVLSQLKGEGYTLGVISNFDSRLPAICKDLGVGDAFDLVRFSSREAKAKPAPEIFEAALRQCGLSPRETLYVGDHPENDVVGAQKVGMAAVLVDRSKGRFGDAQGPMDDESYQRIRDLRGIAAVLKISNRSAESRHT